MEAKIKLLDDAAHFGFNSIRQYFGTIVAATLRAMVPFLVLFGVLVAIDHTFVEEAWSLLQKPGEFRFFPNPIADCMRALFSKYQALTAITVFLLMYIGQAFLVGVSKIALNIYDYKASPAASMYQRFGLINEVFLVSCLYSLFVFFGNLLFILPGIIVGIRCAFFSYFIVDNQADSNEPLTMSWRMTSGYFWMIFLVVLCITSINSLLRMIFASGPWVLVYIFITDIVKHWFFVFIDVFIYRTLVPRHEMQINEEVSQ